MVLVQSKESKFGGKCARQECKIQVVVGKPYVFDTEKRKAYCSKECAEMATGQKVVENTSDRGGKQGTWTPKMQQLWRTPDEAVTACKFWHETVIPMIFETCKKLAPSSTSKNGVVDKTIFEKVCQTYEEIFLGKMQGGSKGV